MVVSIESFRPLAGTDATRIRLNDAGDGVIATGTSPTGRAVAWLNETFGSGQTENRQVMRAFVASVRHEYGRQAASAVSQQLASRFAEGRPLSGRIVQVALDQAEGLVKAQKERRADRLAYLGEGPTFSVARALIDKRVAEGTLAPDVRDALLQPGSADRKALEDAIRSAVLQAEMAAGPGLTHPGPAVLATRQAIDEAARRVAGRLQAEALFAFGLAGELPPALQRLEPVLTASGIPIVEGLAALTPDSLAAAQQELGERLGMALGAGAPPESLDRIVEDTLLRTQAQALAQACEQNTDRAQTLLGKLHLPEYPLADPAKGFFRHLQSALLFSSQDAARDNPGWSRFVTAMLRDLDAAFRAQPDRAASIRESLREFSLIRGDSFARLPASAQRLLLRLLADVQGVQMQQASAEGRSTAGLRTEVISALADLVNQRLAELRQAEGLSEAAAMDRLRETDPELIAEMDLALAEGGNSATPGAWLDTRKHLAAMRDPDQPDSARALNDRREAAGTDIQRLLSAGLRAIALELFDHARATLGEPPVPFTVLGLGSTARGEASPFSDLEFAILLPDDHTPEDRRYFVELSERVRDQITAIGENGSYLRGEGFHFDANLNPARRPDLFMNSADGLLREGLAPKGGPHDWTRTAFANAEWLYGSDAGRSADGSWQEPTASWHAVQDFHARLQQHLATPGPQGAASVGVELGRWTLDLARGMGSDGLVQAQRGEIDVKALARLPMLLVQGLAIQHGLILDPQTGVVANSTFQRLHLLVEAGVLSSDDANAILTLQDQLSEMRVRSHFHHGRQEDTVATTEAAAQRSGRLYEADLAPLVEQAQALLQRVELYLGTPGAAF